MDTYNKIKVDEKKGLDARYTDVDWDGDGKLHRVTCTRFFDARVKIDQVKKFMDDYAEKTEEMSKGKMKVTFLQIDDGCEIVLNKLKTPMVMDDRSLITAQYFWTSEDGSFHSLGTDKGNDACYEQYCDLIGKDTLMKQRLSYNHFYE